MFFYRCLAAEDDPVVEPTHTYPELTPSLIHATQNNWPTIVIMMKLNRRAELQQLFNKRKQSIEKDTAFTTPSFELLAVGLWLNDQEYLKKLSSTVNMDLAMYLQSRSNEHDCMYRCFWHFAAWGLSPDFISACYENKLFNDLEVYDSNGLYVWHYLMRNQEFTRAFAVIIQHRKESTSTQLGHTLVHSMAENGNIEAFKVARDQNIFSNWDVTDRVGNTWRHFVCLSGNEELINAEGIDYTTLNSNGLSPAIVMATCADSYMFFKSMQTPRYKAHIQRYFQEYGNNIIYLLAYSGNHLSILAAIKLLAVDLGTVRNGANFSALARLGCWQGLLICIVRGLCNPIIKEPIFSMEHKRIDWKQTVFDSIDTNKQTNQATTASEYWNKLLYSPRNCSNGQNTATLQDMLDNPLIPELCFTLLVYRIDQIKESNSPKITHMYAKLNIPEQKEVTCAEYYAACLNRFMQKPDIASNPAVLELLTHCSEKILGILTHETKAILKEPLMENFPSTAERILGDNNARNTPTLNIC
jgi:hypothetical protein